MKGLAPHTLQVFEAVSKLDCIKSYLLVGGTALSLQMGTRQNEDLDFMKWHTSKTEKKGCIPLGISLLVCGPAWA